MERHVRDSADAAATLLAQTYIGPRAAAAAAKASPATNTRAIQLERFQSHEELAVLRAIVARESALDELFAHCSAFERDDDGSDGSVELLESILTVRTQSLAVVDAIAGWRRRMVQTLPFRWRGVNYLLKMTSDLDFVSRSHLARAALDGARLVKRNPFSTIGGLDQSMRVCWQHELPDAADLPVLLDSTAFADAGLQIDAPSRLRFAEHMLLLEEKRFGRLSTADAARVDDRLETLVRSEAAFATKSRFGSVKQRMDV